MHFESICTGQYSTCTGQNWMHSFSKMVLEAPWSITSTLQHHGNRPAGHKQQRAALQLQLQLQK